MSVPSQQSSSTKKRIRPEGEQGVPSSVLKSRRTIIDNFGNTYIATINGTNPSPYIEGAVPPSSIKDPLALAFSNEESSHTLDNYCFNREGTIVGKKKINTNTIKAFIIPRTDKLDNESK